MRGAALDDDTSAIGSQTGESKEFDSFLCNPPSPQSSPSGRGRFIFRLPHINVALARRIGLGLLRHPQRERKKNSKVGDSNPPSRANQERYLVAERRI